MHRNIINKIKIEYDRMRLKSKSDLEIRKRELYEIIPEIKKIDDEIAHLNIKIAKSFFSENDHPHKTKNYREQINELIKEKNLILDLKNIPDNFLTEVYKCSLCSDTGYMENGIQCRCFRQKIAEELYRISPLKDVLEKENFDYFDISLYENDSCTNEDMTPAENIKYILNDVMDFIRNFESTGRNLLFYGHVGTGKTFMCNCIGKYLMESNYIVMYFNAFKIIETISNHRFDRENETEENAEKYKMIYDCDLLIIDDLGTESINSFTNTELYNIINSRLMENKNTIISTNLSMEKMSEIYSDRIMSRIINYDIYKFYGSDLRIKKKLQGTG